MHHVAEDEDEETGRRLEETKRVARLVMMAALLATQPRRWPRARLAERFGICERQVARDLDVLRHGLGYQIRRTVDGYVIDGAPVLPPLALTMPEVLTLAVAAGLARDSGGVDPATLGAVMAKLEALVPPNVLALLRRDVAKSASTPSVQQARLAPFIALVQQALLERRRLRIVYETGSRNWERTERTVEPYYLQRHYGRFWILTAYDHRRKQVLNFKLSRIREASLLDERYTIPDDFDLAGMHRDTWGVMVTPDVQPFEVKLLFSVQAGHWLQEEDWSSPMTLEAQPDGSVVASLHTRVTPEFIRWILWHGPDCRVLEPASLRDRVREALDEAARAYQGGTMHLTVGKPT